MNLGIGPKGGRPASAALHRLEKRWIADQVAGLEQLSAGIAIA
jgi:hypothetical protein